MDRQLVKKFKGRRNMEGFHFHRREGSQFRRANIVYFLSHNGAVEQPHLLRVHHLHNNGVHLRNVKRWLAELRGKDMPDSFAWSYKRRYKSGYVWQDLKDEDLITPISDNEYVLKGSLLKFHSLNGFSSDEIDETVKTAKKIEEKPVTEHQEVPEPKTEPETLQIEQDYDESPQLDHDSPDKSNKQPNNTDRRMAVFKINMSAKKQEEEQRFRRSYSHRASNVFRNILMCGAADTNDSVLMPISRDGSGRPHRRRSTSDVPRQQKSESDNSRKSRRSSGGKSAGSANYKPLGAPNCLQCGRPFDPEKLHSHMQSCKALRGRQKGRISVDRMPLGRESCTEEDFSRESISGYLN